MIESVWKDERDRIVVVADGAETRYDMPICTLFDRWHRAGLTTYAGQRKAMAKALGIRRRQPVVIDRNTALAMLEGPRSAAARFVNVHALELIEQRGEATTFVFRSGAVWRTPTPAGLARRLEDAMRASDHLYGGGIDKKMLSWCRKRKRNRGNSDPNLV